MKIHHGSGRRGLLACGCLLTLASWCVSAAPPRLVRDINPNPQPISSTPRDFGQESEPWVTDGTTAGTQLLDTNPGPSHPAAFTDFHGVTWFETQRNNYSPRRLWRTNGTAAGTRSIGDFTLGAERVAANQKLFYVANHDAAGVELFVIDNERPSATDDAL